MKQRSEELRLQMMEEIGNCTDNGKTNLPECCFRTSAKYWELLREELKLYTFNSDEEEVDFFKNIKPLFQVESEYFSMLNYAENFCPPVDKLNDQKNFWIREMNRQEKFIDRNGSFYMYYTSGRTDHDIVYFTRAEPSDADYTFDSARSGWDKLVAQLWACQRYRQFAGEKVQATIEQL